MAEPLRSSRTILGVPIKTELAPLRADASRYLARSTVLMHDKATNERFFFGGASVDARPAVAETTSQFEVVERVFAMPVWHRGRPTFPTFDYFSDEPVDRAAADDVLITDKGALATAEPRVEDDRTRGAVGLGLGSTSRQAKAHGLFEAIERHLRSSIWYRDRFIRQLAGDTMFAEHYRLRRYCVDRLPIPFCLSVITSEDPAQAVFYTGSAVSSTFVSACDKADNEALMMLDSHLSNRNGWANTEHSRERFLSLSGRGASTAQAYLESRVRGHGYRPNPRCHSQTEIVEALLGRDSDVRYSELMHRDGLFLVRVFAPELTWERRERARNLDWPVTDPFC